jgi:hypothetical protein
MRRDPLLPNYSFKMKIKRKKERKKERIAVLPVSLQVVRQEG